MVEGVYPIANRRLDPKRKPLPEIELKKRIVSLTSPPRGVLCA